MHYTMRQVHDVVASVLRIDSDNIKHCVVVAQTCDGRARMLTCGHGIDVMIGAVLELIIREEEIGESHA